MKKVSLSIYIITALLAAGCQKYVDIRTKGQLIPSETENYRYIMNQASTLNFGDGYNDLASDDVDFVDLAQQQSLANYTPYNNYYTWAEKMYDASSQDYNWNGMYTIVYNCNTVLEGVMGSNNGTSTEKNQIYGEALVHRADAYLTLVKAYGKAYDSATAATDLGVPLLLKAATESGEPRASVQAVYSRIVEDLKQAAPLLSRTTQLNTFPTRAAAFALLARVSLDMGNYTDAITYADSTLAIKNAVLDMNTLNGNIPRATDNPEVILTKFANASMAYAPAILRLSDEMANLLGTADLRYQVYTGDANAYADPSYTGRMYLVDYFSSYPQARNCGVTVPEVMLIKAECVARKGQASPAMDLVNALRVKRFAAADYVAETAANADEALRKVLDERRRELFCRGFRWNDLKRLNKEARFAKTITRNFNGVTYTLAPGSNRYVFPIADYYFSFNTNLVQNPR
ncbi:SusD family protein [Filimonas lacunae]|uniref:SusD family protein n=1 Tax=Filimonas lacunae TaxID=477680 RepID=A0A173MD73_9BACT|nr:RagB/SusD family nutrient uptake outer membrane protein [Filimonas lacunae]BAV05388.1 hypothetical protein FLA_1395 [Filimonas lacunae]SIT21537.1 SusD family protein [Filimonas lacunae]